MLTVSWPPCAETAERKANAAATYEIENMVVGSRVCPVQRVYDSKTFATSLSSYELVVDGS